MFASALDGDFQIVGDVADIGDEGAVMLPQWRFCELPLQERITVEDMLGRGGAMLVLRLLCCAHVLPPIRLVLGSRIQASTTKFEQMFDIGLNRGREGAARVAP